MSELNMDKKQKIWKVIIIVLFIIYIVILSTLLFFDSMFAHRSFMGRHIQDLPTFSAERFEYGTNIVPFRTISSYFNNYFGGHLNTSTVVRNILGNIAAFAPFGLFLPLLFKRFRKFIPFTLIMVLVISLAEMIQFITRVGSLDIDDLILNILGAIIVFLVIKIPVMAKLILNITGINVKLNKVKV